jgi:hypothetical protein
LNERVVFQREWKTISMGLYVLTTMGTIVFTSTVTILAAFKVLETGRNFNWHRNRLY